MKPRKLLFVDRDGTLIEEPPDEQVDSAAKVRLMPEVVPALRRLRDAGYEFVIVSNQDGLGTADFLHSYALPPDDSTRGQAEHGAVFSAVVEHGNYYGAQFHPERSSANGARLLANFLALES